MHSLATETEFLDRVYEAAIEPDRWTGVLEHIAALLGGSAANLTFQDQVTGKGRVLGYNVDTSLFGDYFGYFATRNPLLKIQDLPLALRVVTDEDKIAKEDLVRSEYYNEFLRSIDTHSALIFRLAIDGDSTTVLNVARPQNREPFRGPDVESARRLHPHLVRAFRLAARLSNMEALHTGFEDFLSQSPNAVFVVGANGKLRHANPAGETMLTLGRGLTVQSGALRAGDSAAARELQTLIAAASDSDAERRKGGAMLLRHPGRRSPISLSVMPARSRRVSLFQPEPAVLVCAIDLDASADVPEQRLRELFGLSRAECRVAQQLLQGRDTRETARALGLSYNTVRAHLVRMLAKTDTNRQTELVRKMTRALGV